MLNVCLVALKVQVSLGKHLDKRAQRSRGWNTIHDSATVSEMTSCFSLEPAVRVNAWHEISKIRFTGQLTAYFTLTLSSR